MPAYSTGAGGAANIINLDSLDNQEYRGLVIEDRIAGESLAFGDIVYHKSDNRWYKTDADDFGKVEGALGIVLTTGTINENGYFTVLKKGTVKNTSWSFTVGEDLWISDTAGAITGTKPTSFNKIARRIGFAHATNVVYFHPDSTWQHIDMLMYASDETQISTTNTASTLIKHFWIVHSPGYTADFNKLLLVVYAANDTAAHNTYIEIYEDSVLKGTLTFAYAAGGVYTTQYAQLDISGWTDPQYHIEIKMRVDSGSTGHQWILENWLKDLKK